MRDAVSKPSTWDFYHVSTYPKQYQTINPTCDTLPSVASGYHAHLNPEMGWVEVIPGQRQRYQSQSTSPPLNAPVSFKRHLDAEAHRLHEPAHEDRKADELEDFAWERHGFLDSKFLSRQHVEVWEEDGKVLLAVCLYKAVWSLLRASFATSLAFSAEIATPPRTSHPIHPFIHTAHLTNRHIHPKTLSTQNHALSRCLRAAPPAAIQLSALERPVPGALPVPAERYLSAEAHRPH
ncbi:hypothetical protein CVT25_001743 [Psilocybe cyanescens]|uniref:Uncharacterized protein n=1 Tax=Psilocybe cyanescens TaxID=93625 RepID=A0A409XSA8_PSICY|nr:hypothetical protein CVT25_001743 [Psilocybe cyanescens]